MPLRQVAATRYVTPLREGGSLPAIVEADDSGLYVVKFRGAGQGVRVLVAELICAELARALGLPVPETALVELPEALGRNEPDPEIHDLLLASVGSNFGLDYLPGAVTFDPIAGPPPEPDLASAIVWFDAFVTNVDRTAKNPNLLSWHRRLYLIDHGAALYFHHDWSNVDQQAEAPFAASARHVLLPFATKLKEADQRLRPMLSASVFERAVAQLPDDWLRSEPLLPTPDAARAGYVRFLTRRLAAADRFLEEALRGRAQLV